VWEREPASGGAGGRSASAAERGAAADSPGRPPALRSGHDIADLALYLAARDGVFDAATPIAIARPRTSSRPPDALVRRYASGAITADAIELRSGAERGAHTDARMVAGHDAIAVTWQVGPPELSHGSSEEVPRHPGPRLAILRCAQ
jgi:hypothetical protein